MRLKLFVAFLCAGLSACASTPRLGESGLPMAVSVAPDLPAPTALDLTQSVQPYLIGPLDKLTVRVFGVEELSGEVQADSSGDIQFPLIGTVSAAGTTPAQLAQEIAARLRGRYVRDPQVTVGLREGTSQAFSIDGQVNDPGSYQISGNMSLMRAVAVAKGTNEFAKLDDVVVFRTVQGKPMAALYNLGAIRTGIYADPRIYSNDIIVVGDSKARRLFKDILAIAPALATPLVILLQQ